MIMLLVVIMWLASAVLSSYIMAKKVGVDVEIVLFIAMIFSGPVGLFSSLVGWAQNSGFVVMKGK